MNIYLFIYIHMFINIYYIFAEIVFKYKSVIAND